MLTDTHAHLCSEEFDHDLAEVINNAARRNISAIIVVGETLADARKNLQLADQYPAILPAAGLYPSILDPDQAAVMEGFIRDHCDRLVAIGEVGLDFWIAKEESERNIQKAIFSRFIDLSLELDLPLNVHSRSAGRQAIALLMERGAKRVQLHAFDGKYSAAMPAIECGFFFSIPPSIVRSRQKQKLVKNLPLSCLLLESDSPVLGPDPEQRNEPANITLAIDTICEIKKIPRDTLLEHVRENTYRLYGQL